MASQLKIDQATLSPAGTAGKSRTDGKSGGQLVTLTNTGTGSTTLFRLLDTPPGDINAVTSLAVTGNPKVWTFTPTTNVYGSYLIELIENAGQPSEIKERRVLGIRTPNKGLLIPALNEGGDRGASLLNAGSTTIQAADNNADDYPTSSLNSRRYAAWWRSLAELILQVDSATGSGSGATGPQGLPGEDGRDGVDGLPGATGPTGPSGGGGTPTTRVFVNAASTKVGTTFSGVTVEAATTLATAGDLGAGSFFIIRTCASGSSGVSGDVAIATEGGELAGGGGAWNERTFTRAEVLAALPIVITAALGGAAANGPSISGTTAVANDGAPGGPSAFGSLLVSFGGSSPGHLATNRSGAAGGGTEGAGTGPAGTTTTGGAPGGVAGQIPNSSDGGAGGQVGIGRQAYNGGASGGGATNGSNTAGNNGGQSRRGGGGGGSSGGATLAAATPGGAGGKSGSQGTSSLTNGGGGTAGPAGTGAGTTATAAGDGADGNLFHGGDGGGGGGGNFGTASVGGKGGAGGFPGGGGGAGGVCVRTTGTLGTAGGSGKGGDGLVIMISVP